MRKLIDDGAVHVFDGAMGTELYARGIFVNVCYDAVTLDKPELIRRIHAEYVAAGAEILEANTFGANPIRLSPHGLVDRTEEINRVAVTVAREAAAGRASVVGAMGPLGVRIEPYGPTPEAEATAAFTRQVDGLIEGGVDGFVLETFSDLAELRCAFEAVRTASDLPVVAQMTIGEDAKTAYGTDAAQLARALTELGVDVIGLNCSVGPAVMLDALEEMADTTDLPLSAQPNAGLPRTVRDRQIYLAGPDYMAEYARRMVELGVRFVGGCCGTTPAHIQKLAEVVGGRQSKASHPVEVQAAPREAADAVESVPLAERSALGAKLARGETVVSVEIVPPHGWDPQKVVEPARALHAAGIDAVSLVDGYRSRNRMGARAAAAVIEREVGIETLVHYACRGRDMPGMLSDLLGAAAVGLRNILVVSGDAPATGPQPGPGAGLDIDSIGLTNVVQRLNRGLDPGGNAIGAPTRFVQGVEVDQAALDLEVERQRFTRKIEAGADFAVSRPLFDIEPLAPFIELACTHGVPVVACIWLLPTLRSAEFLANEMPGLGVPEEAVRRMRKAEESGPEAALDQGVAIALATIEAARPHVQGFHLSAPRKHVGFAERVLREARLTTERDR